jgi:hypothetical protein
MALLIYSDKCKHSRNVLDLLNSHEELKQITRLHCVDTHGLPPDYKQYVTSVPTIITNKKQILVGQECKKWLESLIPPEEISHCQLGGGWSGGCCSLEGGDEEGGNLFNLNNYGMALQPAMTPELQDKINKKVS